MANKTKRKIPGWVSTIAVILAIVLAMGLVLSLLTGGMQDWSKFQQNKQDDEVYTVQFSSAKIPRDRFADYNIPLDAEDAYFLMAMTWKEDETLADTALQSFNFELDWIGESEENVSEYMTMTATNSTVVLALLQPFGTQLSLTATVKGREDIFASIPLDYSVRLTELKVASPYYPSEVLTFSKNGGYHVTSDFEYQWSSIDVDFSRLSGLNLTEAFSIGTLEDEFTYAFTVSYSAEWIAALKAQGFTTDIQSGVEYPLSGYVRLHGLTGLEACEDDDAFYIREGYTGCIGASLMEEGEEKQAYIDRALGAWNRFSAAGKAMNGGTIMTIKLTATGNYSTMEYTCPCSVEPSLYWTR